MAVCTEDRGTHGYECLIQFDQIQAIGVFVLGYFTNVHVNRNIRFFFLATAASSVYIVLYKQRNTILDVCSR
jgi:hypothetical protein